MHESSIESLSITPDGSLLASCSYKAIQLWKLPGGALQTLTGHTDWVVGVAFSPAGDILASASFDKTVRLWRLDDVPLKTLDGHQNRVQSVTFSPDGQKLASASTDKTIKLWSRTGVLLKTLEGHTQRVASVSFSPAIAASSHQSISTVRRPPQRARRGASPSGSFSQPTA